MKIKISDGVWLLSSDNECREQSTLENGINFLTSGQSYKQFTIIIYDSRVVIWAIF